MCIRDRSSRCLLVENGNKLTLIDAGMGDKQSEKFFSFYKRSGDYDLVSSIKSAGFSTDDITDVLLTHLHFDHCGGASIKNNFGKKIYLTDKEILNYYVKNYSQINKESLANITLIIINELEGSEEKISKLRSLESNEASFNSLILEYKKNKIISEESGNLGYLNPIDLGAEIGDAIQSASLNSLIGPFSYNGSSRYFYGKFFIDV